MRILGLIGILVLGINISVDGNLNAQTISTFAGGGTSTGDGVPATSVQLNRAFAGTFDTKGNFYFIDGQITAAVRKVNTSGIISTAAGNETAGYSGDNGPATAARLNYPIGIVTDTFGNLYIADSWNNRIRKVNANTGIITTWAGNGLHTFSGDGGQASAASIVPVADICMDAFGNFYVPDSSQRIRKIDPAGIITTIAGTGIAGTTGDGGLATDAEVAFAYGISTDKAGNVYYSDHNCIRKIEVSTGIINTIAGNGNGTYYGDGIPATAAQMAAYAITFDKFNNLFICDASQRVRMIDASGIIYTIAGNGIAGYSGDGGPASAAEIHDPEGIALDSCDNIFISDNSNFRIREVTYPKCNFLGVPEVFSSNELSVYPNPTYAQLNIDNLKTPSTYRLLSIVGAVMQQGTLKEGNNSISIQAIPNGLYMLEVIDDKEQRIVYKIIKQ